MGTGESSRWPAVDCLARRTQGAQGLGGLSQAVWCSGSGILLCCLGRNLPPYMRPLAGASRLLFHLQNEDNNDACLIELQRWNEKS